MKIGRGTVFRVICVLSLLVAVAMAMMWIKSMRGEAHLLSFVKAGERFTLRSKSGQLMLTGPPQGGMEEPRIAELASQMSNGDFAWRAERNRLVLGFVRDQTPSWKMWQANWKLWEATVSRPNSEEMLGPQRIWLRAMEDPRRCAPAHMMLLAAAPQKLERYFRPDRNWGWNRSSTGAQTPETMAFGGPLIVVTADASGAEPDSKVWMKLRQNWHDVLDETRWAVFHGWLLLDSMVMPLAWLARPKWTPRTWRRWALNGLALLAGIICIAGTAAWVRSHWASDAWAFWPRPVEAPSGMSGRYRWHWWIGSSADGLMLGDLSLPENSGMQINWGFQRGSFPGLVATRFGPSLVGQRHLKFAGFDFYSAKRIWLTNSGVPMTWAGQYDIREFTIGWWLVVGCSGLLPLAWTWREVKRWRRIRRERRIAGKLCLKCGYDLRATPGRCPECGSLREETNIDGTIVA